MIVHGYLLEGTGSNIYVQNLCRAFCMLGHNVSLFCQEPSPEKFDFISQFVEFDPTNKISETKFSKETPYQGTCTYYRPHLNGFLPVYVYDDYSGFTVKTYIDASQDEIDLYINYNETALKTIFNKIEIDLIISNHGIMQPLYAARAQQTLEIDCYHINVVHGSCLNFSIRKRALLKEYAIDAISRVNEIVVISDFALREFLEYYDELKGLSEKTRVIPAGVDVDLFKPATANDLSNLPDSITRVLDLKNIKKAQEQVVLFYGKLLWTKGSQLLLAAAPLILKENPNTYFVIIGKGSSEKYLKTLFTAIASGDKSLVLELFREIPEINDEFQIEPEFYFKNLIVQLNIPKLAEEYFAAASNLKDRVLFPGFLNHDKLRWIIPHADVALFPSIFPEAFGLVAVEALSAGVFPLQTNHSGFKDVIEVYKGEMSQVNDFPELVDLDLTENLVLAIADNINVLLGYYQKMSLEERAALKIKAQQIAIDHYSWQSVAEKLLKTVHRD